jgi:polysaccharide export outer membrane protein
MKSPDGLSVSIWQASNGQGLAPRPDSGSVGQPTAIPDQVVAADGAISVPYAGRIRVAGRTPLQVQQAIEQHLAEQVVQPQAIVSVTKVISNSATVLGDLATAARVPLPTGGERLLDVIAAAGGSKSPFYETSIIYVANAPMNELQKFFTLLGTITGPVIGGTVVVHGTSH